MANSNSTATPNRGNKVMRFLREVKAEMKKVVWPTKNELINNTIVVFVTVLIVSAIIGIFDSIFSRLFHLLLQMVR